MENKVMSKTFVWMFFGLLITFLTGYFVSTNETMMLNVQRSSVYIVLCLGELGLVLFLASKIRTMGKNMARMMFLLYSFVTGLSLSSVFIVYKLTSIIFVFLIAAVVFLLFGFLGYVIKIDLTKFGTYLLMALIAVLVCYIVNLFLLNNTLDLVLAIISILIFMGFTAYDVQKIKQLANDSSIPEENLSIIGALNLYIDYINIFFDLLRLFGDLKD